MCYTCGDILAWPDKCSRTPSAVAALSVYKHHWIRMGAGGGGEKKKFLRKASLSIYLWSIFFPDASDKYVAIKSDDLLKLAGNRRNSVSHKAVQLCFYCDWHMTNISNSKISYISTLVFQSWYLNWTGMMLMMLMPMLMLLMMMNAPLVTSGNKNVCWIETKPIRRTKTLK